GELLADADNGAEPALEHRARLLADRLVGVAEQLAPLAVADDRPGRAGVAKQSGRDLAGEGAARLPVTILCAGRDRRALEALRDGADRREHRRDADRDALHRAELVLELGHERERLGDRLVELPVADHERGAHARYVSRGPGHAELAGVAADAPAARVLSRHI